ncbi:MAG: CHAT domain-containing protein [Novosphingobium sp. 28-62-57]|uniref:CHAT domain-containing protein n=1 Tax=unclassified Novosphingobium TaxID=2644732 RepID=UPI000BCDBDA5|nr:MULTISPECIES: CHAT domain-containing tetratricopeptide repeat protein [unclassified Novosphingobium]OYW49604.1 MAG: CHAT domain-containing protein [Novosphingobium sp. 12-62-10]OYZ12440.1 MAG: CHAT domain-containing protein [Novosphingobium sp. 28-62-57]OZA39971.1 MAG: CHAT domain-containing protein [Novosphingobium sp. 17-62-9]HQS68422.1 CHAT domain-containing protein [Novosphingobium sp.]
MTARRSIHRAGLRSGVALALAVLASASGVKAATDAQPPLSIRNSFRIGTSGVTCTAQNAPADARLGGMFDRGYRLSCRDAAGAVGTLIAVRRAIPLQDEPTGLSGVTLSCGATGSVMIDGVGRVSAANCRDQRAQVEYKRYAVSRNGVSYLVEGLAGYDPALRLALASVFTDSRVPGEIKVATTEVTDPAAFARVQAGQLDRLGARGEGYARNNSGRFAESAEFFEALASRDRAAGGAALAEALANQGLQQSNLGNFEASSGLFGRASAAIARADGVTQRLLRNYRAIDQLNQRQPAAALAELAKPVNAIGDSFDFESLSAGFITRPLSEQINRESSGLKRLGAVDPGLTDLERAEILDAQAVALAATAARMQGRLDQALSGLQSASARLANVREGRVISMAWLRSEIELELATVAEAQGRKGEAVAAYDRALTVLESALPQTPALLAARARKAGWLGRSGDEAGAIALFADVIAGTLEVPEAGANLRNLVQPYFGLLAQRNESSAASAVFAASQVLQRPGVAQTQAVLARQMSEGNDDASALFRLSLARTRDIARTEATIAQLSLIAAPTDQQQTALKSAQDDLAYLQREQTELVSKLAAFPRYSVLAPKNVAMAELQSALKPGESYYKLMVVGDYTYGLYITPQTARVVPISATPTQLSAEVQALRDTIVKVENGRQVNYPFDAERAHRLYKTVFGSVEDLLSGTRHLIFEPDGAMLQLPPTVLITDDKGIAAYNERMESPDGDAFDFTGMAWLGRGREVSIAVSPRGFLDIRKLGASVAPRNYLGLGHNAKPAPRPVTAVADECDWPLATWMNPISADELLYAQKKLDSGGSKVQIDTAFSDSALLADQDLDKYRVLHFATHGLVTAPRAGCPARPALVTSFGNSGSDGLLSFREIFDLKLDADLVILSACDTAGMASVAASREAGVTSGGNYALDGLVRAFVGAGARSVIASHWPVPDDFDATKRLISGVIEAGPGQPLGEGLEAAQQKLMDDPNTSHPFYWAAFVIVGDGAKPLLAKDGKAM